MFCNFRIFVFQITIGKKKKQSATTTATPKDTEKEQDEIETLPKNAVIKTLQLTKSQRINKSDVQNLKNKYEEIELM